MKPGLRMKVAGAALLFGLALPPLIYWLLVLRVSSATPEAAEKILRTHPEASVLLDVRPAPDYAAMHIPGAAHVPYDAVAAEMTLNRVRNKPHVFVICRAGVLSARATLKLHDLGIPGAKNVAGGMDAWLTRGKRGEAVENVTVQTPDGLRPAIPRVNFTLVEQAVICAAAFGLKPLYELVSLIIVILLWKKTAPDVAALRRGMIAFFLGENACAVNFLFFNEQSHIIEFFHGYGMLACFGFVVYALMKAADIRILKFTNAHEKCALLPLCKTCYKYRDASCNLRLIFLFMPPAAAALGLMPLSASMKPLFCIGEIFGGDVIFNHPAFYQAFEIRFYPLAAILFFVLSFIVLVREKEKGFTWSKILFAMGAGPLAFSLMRFFVYWSFSDNLLWADAWEEITESLFIGFVLWIVVRARVHAPEPLFPGFRQD